MKAFDHILLKQTQWAIHAGIRLQGSKKTRGQLLYSINRNDNLFEPLSSEVEQQFKEADGQETNPADDSSAPKMNAIHSSSALAVNVFHYWRSKGTPSAIAHACGLCSSENRSSMKIAFERKLTIKEEFSKAPNIDVLFDVAGNTPIRAFAVESKFSEPYSGRGHAGLKRKYVDAASLWDDLPELFTLGREICPDDGQFHYLHAAQLVKHILGLKLRYGKRGFRLLYLWYDGLGSDGAEHRREIERFAQKAAKDQAMFCATTYQEVIGRLARQYRESDPEYIRYITTRYL